MTTTELQQWLNIHGQAVVVDGLPGPETRNAIKAAFANTCAAAVTDADIQVLATRLNCSPKQIRAVSMVESSGGGFDAEGRPKILFERHLFHRFTQGVYTPAPYSQIKGGGYNESSWNKLLLAACLDADAAFAATSWGKFQVLGAHARGDYPKFLNLGYPSPIDMAYSAVTGEAAHYEMLARYIEKTGIRWALKALSTDPETNRPFAKAYNGGGYEQFDYHTKLAKAMR